MSNFADGLFPGHLAFLMLLPFVMLGFGLWFICRAFTDKVDARPGSRPEARIAVLPDRKDRPLYRVHLQIRASARPRPSPQKEGVNGGRSPLRHRNLRGHHGLRRRTDLGR
jgi:hypothetical protein